MAASTDLKTRPYFPQPKPKKPYRNRKYLQWVKLKPCMFCGMLPGGSAHHVRWGDDCGLNTKPSDSRVVPVCHICHGAIHSMSGSRYRDMIKRVGREEMLEVMWRQADDWIRGER